MLEFSRRPTDWVAILTLTIALFAFAISVVTIWLEQAHRRLSVRPIPSISYIHSLSEFRLEVENAGVGPMLVDKLVFTQPDGSTSERLFKKLVFDSGALSAIPDPVYLARIDGRTPITSGAGVVLAEYRVTDGAESLVGCLEDLAFKISISVYYTDIYESEFEPLTYQLPSGTTFCEQ